MNDKANTATQLPDCVRCYLLLFVHQSVPRWTSTYIHVALFYILQSIIFTTTLHTQCGTILTIRQWISSTVLA